jgi:threonine/homoserine/homoserine lactone efflux protein
MLRTLLAFLPVAAVLTLTPGIATALVVRSAARGGQREALHVTVGNSLGVLAWAVFAAVGFAAVVAASAELFTTIKLVGAIVLVILGLQGLLARKADAPPPPPGTALRVGLVTSLANPKLAVFFVALFPQFIPDGAPVLPSALAMAGMVVALDLVWYSAHGRGARRARGAARARAALELDLAGDAGDGAAADPDRAVAVLLDVDLAVTAQRGALAGGVGRGEALGAQQPLGQ